MQHKQRLHANHQRHFQINFRRSFLTWTDIAAIFISLITSNPLCQVHVGSDMYLMEIDHRLWINAVFRLGWILTFVLQSTLENVIPYDMTPLKAISDSSPRAPPRMFLMSRYLKQRISLLMSPIWRHQKCSGRRPEAWSWSGWFKGVISWRITNLSFKPLR